MTPLEHRFADGKREAVLPSVERSTRSLSKARYLLTEATHAALGDSPSLP
ncbi:MAG TPA: hypothetical protein PLU94_02160 [Methanoregulaceae archaeon]|nr:hypothetical protein [Methanoregulaceae archaeon]